MSEVGPAVRPGTWVWPRSAPEASAGDSPPFSRLSPRTPGAGSQRPCLPRGHPPLEVF